MVGLLLHVLYLLGKCIYDRYRRKTRYLPDVANEELFEYDAFDDDSELEDTFWWTHRTIGCFCPPAYIQRYCAVTEVLDGYKGKLWKVVDFGCAELGFLSYLKGIPEVEQILCVDIDREVLERFKDRARPLITEMLFSRERKLTIEICKGSVTDNDVKLKHANAVICIELIEHLYPDTLIDLPFNIFGYIKPEVVIITTPNVEFNVVFPNLSGYRHTDHKFEWTREQFQDWAQNIVVRYPYYSVTFHGICKGPEGTEELGALTQMAVFHRILPRNESRIEILIPDEYIQLKGRHFLFDTVDTYNYTLRRDTRSDEQKILDEAIYYINYLSYNTNDDEEEPRNSEIYLERILYFMTKYPISIETLRSILTDAGWSVEDRENGPVVINPPEDSPDESDVDDWDEYDDLNEDFESTNVENIWDYATRLPIDEIPANANEEFLPEQDPHTERYEEPNITNEENRSGYETNPPVNEIFADEEYLSEQNLHTDSWHEESTFTDEEHRWDYVAENDPLNVSRSDDDKEYLAERNGPHESWYDNPSFTAEDRSNHKIGFMPHVVYDALEAIHEEYVSSQDHIFTENWAEESNFTNVMDRWDYESSPSINQVPADANEEYSFVENPRIENWHEEPSIVIPENCSINHENTYLFDGENSLVEESQPPKEPHATYDDIKQSGNETTAELVYTERELPSVSIPLTLNEVEVKAQVIACSTSSGTLGDSLQLETSVDDITIESALQDDQINLRTTREVASMLNLQPHMSVSRSSTSPVSFYLSFEKSSSQDFSTYYQNELSINNQCLLNSTFRQSEISTETVVNTEESTKDTPCFKKSLPKKDTQESEINSLLHMLPNYNVEQGDVSGKNQNCEDNDMADVISSDAYSNFNNQPKFTSSPRTKTPTMDIASKKSLHRRELMPAMSSNVLLDITEEMKETVSDAADSILLKASQKSNDSSAETIKYATMSSSDTNILKRDVDFSASNSTQQKLCLENSESSDVDNTDCTELIQDTNQEFVENDINRESVVEDVRNIDKCHALSLGNESINRKDKNVYCTSAKTDLTKAHLENAIINIAQSNIRKKSLNPPTELLSSKSQSVSKYSSSDCAKETSVLRNDKFVPCKSSEDTSNVYFMSALKNEENVGTSKDVSNIALVNNVEAKPSSPLETPPNSWSPEIMDSGYPNSVSAQDITPEYELPSIAQDYIPDSESPSIAEAPRFGVLEPIEVENGDLANNNRDDEGNNMIAVDANAIENLQPLIDVLENDLENENDIYVMQNGFPVWLLRILDMANPLDFDLQARQNLRIPDEVADDANYIGHDEGFDSSSSESESDIAYNEMENDNGHGK